MPTDQELIKIVPSAARLPIRQQSFMRSFILE